MNEGWQIFLVSEAILMCTGLIAIYVRVNVEIARLNLRMNTSEKDIEEIKNIEGRSNAKLDIILDKITKIQVELVNKANRPN